MTVQQDTPRTLSQKTQIFNYMNGGRSITPIEALDRFGCFRLAAVIFKLREEGHEIHTIEVSQNDKRFAKYVLARFNRNGQYGRNVY